MNERKQPSQNTDHKLRMILGISQSYNPKKRMQLAVNVSLKQIETLMEKFKRSQVYCLFKVTFNGQVSIVNNVCTSFNNSLVHDQLEILNLRMGNLKLKIHISKEIYMKYDLFIKKNNCLTLFHHTPHTNPFSSASITKQVSFATINFVKKHRWF